MRRIRRQIDFVNSENIVSRIGAEVQRVLPGDTVRLVASTIAVTEDLLWLRFGVAAEVEGDAGGEGDEEGEKGEEGKWEAVEAGHCSWMGG